MSLSGSAYKGDIILLYYSYSDFYNYFNLNPNSYDKVFYNSLVYYSINGGDDVFELRYGASGSSKELIDIIGERGVDGTGKAWEYKSGWMKRKDNTFARSTFDVSDWTVCKDCLGDVQYNDEAVTPYTPKSFSSTESAVGSNSNKLTIRDVSYADYHGALVRLSLIHI